MSQASESADSTPVSLEELHAVEQFLYREARMLDDRLYTEWLGLLADDCSYRVPTRESVQAFRGKPPVTIEDELAAVCYFEDDKLTLLAKVLRLGTGNSWGENPPPRPRRLVRDGEEVAEGLDVTRSVSTAVHSGDQIYVPKTSWFSRYGAIIIGATVAGIATIVAFAAF